MGCSSSATVEASSPTFSSMDESKAPIVKTNLFEKILTTEEQSALLRLYEERRFENEDIYTSKSEATTHYILISGDIRLTRVEGKIGGGEESPGFSGMAFGNMFFQPARWSRVHDESAYASGPCVCGVLLRDRFDEFILTHETAASKLRKYFAAELLCSRFREQECGFTDITGERLFALASMFEQETYEKDVCIFNEGAFDRKEGNSLHYLALGKVDVAVQDADGDQLVACSTLSSGDFFGEVGLILDIPRTARCTATTQAIVYHLTKKKFQSFLQLAPMMLKVFTKKLFHYNISLRSFLACPIFCDYFTRHCKAELSEENIEFWSAARDFKNIDAREPPSVWFQEAKKIYEMYIGSGADKQVNVVGRVREDVAKVFTSDAKIQIPHDIFDKASDEILRLMAADSFNRFKESNLFAECIETANSPFTSVLRQLYLV